MCKGNRVVYPLIHLPEDLEPALEGACPSEAAENCGCLGTAVAEAGVPQTGVHK